ncbi:hypothetical protein F4808DRAFT_442010 [Astrocystis sublimbata]|nr:hypothetical protein F4808DRAFT_442010 [Astrocystis sublimbata]
MSGVRNLRAMFEQKGDSQPDDRGRSPGPSGFATPSPTASPRPLSKVRTSFVAVEKDGRIGLRRDPSRDSETVSSRRFSNDTDTSTPFERSDPFTDNMTTSVSSFKKNLAHEPIPESPMQDTTPVKFSSKKGHKSPSLEPNANPDKVTDEEEPKTKMLPSNPTDSAAAHLGGTVLTEGASDVLNSTPSTSTASKTKVTGASKPAAKTAAPVSIAKTALKTSRAPSTKEPAKAAVPAANPKKTTATKTTASKPAALDLPPSGTGFVKPKPKSPTRPVKLPSSLTTHTAASAQKYGPGSAAAPATSSRQSLSRASGNAQHLAVNPTTHRSSSRNSLSPASTTTTTAKTLSHKPSNANIRRSRPSLGPPPKPASKEQPAGKKDAHVDEGFLARMMRPTASSAKKTSDKAVTPPRKQAQPAPIRKVDTKDVKENAKKVVSKMQASAPVPSAQAKPVKKSVQPVAAKEKPTAKEIAPAVAQVETAEAAIEEAKQSTSTAEPSVVNGGESETEASVKDEPVTVEAEPVPSYDGPSELKQNAVTEDPLKVEDIEDTVQEAEEPIHQLQSTESEVEAPQNETAEAAKDAVPVEEPAVEAEKAVEPSEPEHTVAEVEKIEEPKTEAKTEPEPKAEVETAAKTEEVEPETKTEAKSEAEAEIKTEAKPEPEIKTEPKIEPKIDTESETKTEAKTETEVLATTDGSKDDKTEEGEKAQDSIKAAIEEEAAVAL